ncbi:hypothetical protein F5876DRAFT_69581 [Lentinula aff. lateritia]|uniref:Uncharacterized protein n=1 Tax=Lentinula aff. lateritia TaxID=2804960 RepID=A0ACC1TLU9_9AGAR|nr:hypothetical protein F5876DRAFT_69581 [Lentinula aff. lateritia]
MYYEFACEPKSEYCLYFESNTKILSDDGKTNHWQSLKEVVVDAWTNRTRAMTDKKYGGKPSRKSPPPSITRTIPNNHDDELNCGKTPNSPSFFHNRENTNHLTENFGVTYLCLCIRGLHIVRMIWKGDQYMKIVTMVQWKVTSLYVYADPASKPQIDVLKPSRPSRKTAVVVPTEQDYGPLAYAIMLPRRLMLPSLAEADPDILGDPNIKVAAPRYGGIHLGVLWMLRLKMGRAELWGLWGRGIGLKGCVHGNLTFKTASSVFDLHLPVLLAGMHNAVSLLYVEIWRTKNSWYFRYIRVHRYPRLYVALEFNLDSVLPLQRKDPRIGIGFSGSERRNGIEYDKR